MLTHVFLALVELKFNSSNDNLWEGWMVLVVAS
jgi:hypothetical protein